MLWGQSHPGKGLGSAKAMPLCPQLCQASLQPVKSSSQGGAAWGGQQALLPLLLTAWGEQQSPARAGKAVSSQQLQNLLLGETFQPRDPTRATCGCLHRPAAACLAPAKWVQSPTCPCLPRAKDNGFPGRARQSRLVLEGGCAQGCPLGSSVTLCLPGIAGGDTAGNALGRSVSHTPWAARRDGDTHLQE